MIERYRRKGNIEPLLHWVREREAIRKRKAGGLPPPWTDDPILSTYRFCNVRRKHDRVSQWMITNVLQYQGEWEDPLVFLKWVSLCRWVNWPPTLEAIMEAKGASVVTWDQIELKAIGELLDARTKETKAWTGAYMVRAPSKKRWGGMTKGRFVAEIVVGQGLDQAKARVLAALETKRCRAVWEAFSSIPNWGSFMSGQVVADLTYIELLGEAEDLYTWAPVGPGSLRGYNRLLGFPLKTKAPNESMWSEQLVRWRMALIKELGAEYEDLTLHDVQNCLCEVDKFLRAKNGEGRPRSKYKPETAYEV